jgi:UrcA family protein
MLKPARACSATWLGLALAAGAATFAVAQPGYATVDELTVTGRYGVGANVPSLSTAVSYRDLDLTTNAGRDALSQRVRSAAYDLCRRLGESGAGDTALAPSCERDAMNSARDQERLAVATAAPRTYAAGPAPQGYVAPLGPNPADEAASAASYGRSASFTTETVTNGPVPDTAANRRAYGGPMSDGGRRTAPAGN